MPASSTSVLSALRARTYVFAGVLAVLLLVASLIARPDFLAPDALPSTLANLAPLGIVAMATVPSVVSGGFDFSVGPQISLINVMFVSVLIPAGLGGPGAAIPLLVLLGALVGACGGLVVASLRIPVFIVGLASLIIVSGVSQQILPQPVQAPSNWSEHVSDSIGPIPVALLVMLVPLLVWLALRRTSIVTAMYSVGGDAPAAFAAGVNVTAVRIFAYATGGVFAAIAGVALTGVIRSGDATLGLQYTLIAIAAVTLGGTPIGGGRGGLVGALLGATCIFLVQNLVFDANIPAQWLNVIYGLLLIVAVVVGSRLAPGQGGRHA